MNKLVLLLVALVSLQTSAAELVERVIAVVNNEPVLESDITELNHKMKTPALLVKYLLPDNPNAPILETRAAKLDYLIGEKIIESEVKRLNLTITSDKVEQEIRDLAKRNNISVDELYTQIKSEGLSKADYQAVMKGNLERESLMQQEVLSKIRITDEDALAEYLRSHPDARVSVDEFTVAHIFFSPKKGGPEEAKKRAEVVLSKIRAGEKFDALAEQNSEDPNFSSGGLLGTFKSGEFIKEIESAITPLSPGQINPNVIQSRNGFHIVKLISKKVSSDPRFEKDKAAIRARLMEQAAQRQFRIWLQSKREDSFVKINK